MNQSQLPIKVCLEGLSLCGCRHGPQQFIDEEMLVEAKPDVLLFSTGLSQDQPVAMAD